MLSQPKDKHTLLYSGSMALNMLGTLFERLANMVLTEGPYAVGRGWGIGEQLLPRTSFSLVKCCAILPNQPIITILA